MVLNSMYLSHRVPSTYQAGVVPHYENRSGVWVATTGLAMAAVIAALD